MYVPHIYMHVSGKKAQSLTSGMYSKLLAMATFRQGMGLGGPTQIHCLSFKTQMYLCVVYQKITEKKCVCFCPSDSSFSIHRSEKSVCFPEASSPMGATDIYQME